MSSMRIPLRYCRTAAFVYATAPPFRLMSSSATAATADAGPKLFKFTVSDAYKPKKRRPQKIKIKQTNHRVNRPNSGEDSFFYTPSTAKLPGLALGVADGVGGWTEMGIDPSAFSQALCDEMADAFTTHLTQDGNESKRNSLILPKALLEEAYNTILTKNLVEAGGTTACVGVVSNATGVLYTANLGDSGFSVYRSGRVVAQSHAQTHAFNTPYQLAILPRELREFEARQPPGASRHILDHPRDADTASFQLQHGDLVVFSTDGFLDNVSSTEALAIVTKSLLKLRAWVSHPHSGIAPALETELLPELVGTIAAQLVNAAHVSAHDKNKVTPFAKEVQREMRIPYKGGKPDDITIVAFYVTQKPKAML